MSEITAAMLPALLGRPVAYQAVFTRLPGVTVQGAIFLSQALFLTSTPTARAREGWFWKEQAGAVDSWEAETGMSAKQQMTARKQLVALGVLEEVRKGVPAKTWYRVDTDALAKHLGAALEAPKPACDARGCPDSPDGRIKNLPFGESRVAQPESTESPDGSFLTETTTESNPSLSDADAGEAPSVFDRAADLDDQGEPLGADPVPPGPPLAEHRHRQQPMTLEWEPEPASWQRACWERGLAPDADVHHALIDFREHFAARPGRTETPADWTRRFARWVAENRQRQAAREAQPHATPGGAHAHRRDRTPARRLTAAEARARDREAREPGGGAVYEGEHHALGH
ncbi:DnaT-like ssDNA-binding domain-containing protein [Halomonas sp.]|uniref:DnaT-like ssDNA-binding domain-containing protein n=1 Tax=Halomonas sp. TaxID=1486246 RepID=UPI003D0F9D36